MALRSGGDREIIIAGFEDIRSPGEEYFDIDDVISPEYNESNKSGNVNEIRIPKQ